MNESTCCIACGVFRTDLDAMLATGDVTADVTYLKGGLHNEPERLNRELQDAIDNAETRAPDGGWDRIVLLYGLCGQGLAGIRARTTPLIVLRVHDCISLFMGGIDAYRRQFADEPGTYYISAGWFEEQVDGTDPSERIRYPAHCMGDTGDESLRERFGSENADAVHRFLDSWKENYSRCVYIDTGSPEDDNCRRYAEDLARENGWRFEVLGGSRTLIRRCFEAQESSDEVLLIPGGHTIFHDPASGSFSSGPAGRRVAGDENQVLKLSGNSGSRGSSRRLGLGIDAGGTYTDAVIFDFETDTIRAKAKAATTRWRYSAGIVEAVSTLPKDLLDSVDIVSVSTTLVTNAIVEGNRKPVGLLVMPAGANLPGGLPEVPHSKIRGRMTIGGEVTEGVDENEIRKTAADMASRYHLQAFAVSGYGGASNPELEIRVRDIVRNETGLPACCGHEMSGRLNFAVRAATAVLNAGTVPIMDEFLAEMDEAMAGLGIRAPMLMVRGDGTVMARDYARTFPVQAALSGPAASMAGAMYLTGLNNAVVIDVGGTTSDIGLLEDGRVAVTKDGARIGNWTTHVEAVDMLTIGLGGDSEVVYEAGEWILGPRRVAPMCRLFEDSGDPSRKELLRMLEGVGDNPSFHRESSRPIQVLVRTDRQPDFTLSGREELTWNALENGPASLQQLAEITGLVSWKLLHTRRLEAEGCLVRHGFTPTDLFLIGGQLTGAAATWDSDLAAAALRALCSIAGIEEMDLNPRINKEITRGLSRGLLERLVESRNGEPALEEAVLNHGRGFLGIKPELRTPLIALGAPASLMVGGTTEVFNGEMADCENGDVANAIGAITSRISVSAEASVVPNGDGGFTLRGLDTVLRSFESLEEAEEQCISVLSESVRAKAREAGTSEEEVSISISSETATTKKGSLLLIRRKFRASITGAPDLA